MKKYLIFLALGIANEKVTLPDLIKKQIIQNTTFQTLKNIETRENISTFFKDNLEFKYNYRYDYMSETKKVHHSATMTITPIKMLNFIIQKIDNKDQKQYAMELSNFNSIKIYLDTLVYATEYQKLKELKNKFKSIEDQKTIQNKIDILKSDNYDLISQFKETFNITPKKCDFHIIINKTILNNLNKQTFINKMNNNFELLSNKKNKASYILNILENILLFNFIYKTHRDCTTSHDTTADKSKNSTSGDSSKSANIEISLSNLAKININNEQNNKKLQELKLNKVNLANKLYQKYHMKIATFQEQKFNVKFFNAMNNKTNLNELFKIIAEEKEYNKQHVEILKIQNEMLFLLNQTNSFIHNNIT